MPLSDGVRKELSSGLDSFVLDEASIEAVALLGVNRSVSRETVVRPGSKVDVPPGAIVANVMPSLDIVCGRVMPCP